MIFEAAGIFRSRGAPLPRGGGAVGVLVGEKGLWSWHSP